MKETRTAFARHILRAAVLLSAIGILIFHIPLHATSYTNKQSGDWNVAQTWGGTGIPVAGDIVTIAFGSTVTIPTGYNAACAELTIGDARAAANFPSEIVFGGTGSSLTVSGTVTIGAIQSGFTTVGKIDMTSGGTLSAGAFSVIAFGSWTPGTGTVVLAGTNLLPSGINSFHNLVLNGTTRVKNDISLTGSWTNNSSFIPGTYGVTFNGATQSIGGSQATTFNNLTIGSGSTTTAAANLSVAGSWTNGGTFVPSTYLVTFNGTAQSIGGSQPTAFNHLTINSGSTITAAANISVKGNWINNGTYVPSTHEVTFNGIAQSIGGSQPTAFNHLTIGTGSNTTAAVNLSVKGNWYNNGTFTPSTHLVTFNGAAQSIGGSQATAFNNLTISGSSSITAAASIPVAGNWINDGTFTPSTYFVTFNGTAQSISGSQPTAFHDLTIASGSNTTAAANISVKGNWVNHGIFTPASSLVTFNGTAQSIGGSQPTAFNHLTISTGSNLTAAANLSLLGNWTNNGTFTPSTYLVSFNGAAQSLGGSQPTAFNDLTMSGGTVTANANIILTGNWTNNAVFVPGSGTVTFLGTGYQTLGGTSSTTFNTLTINKSDGTVSLQRPTTVNGNLSFASFTVGKIVLGAHNLTLSASSTISGYGAATFVVTDGTGMLTRNGVGATSVVFPIGPSVTSYNPATVSNAGIADAFSMKVRTGFDNLPYSNAIVDRQWSLAEAIPGGSDLSMTFQWAMTDEASGFSRTSSLFLGRWNGSAWEAAPATFTDNLNGTYTVSMSGILLGTPIAIGNMGALPVELTSFSARLRGTDAVLQWNTATELNNFGFDIERSTDRENWESVGFVPGHGSSASPKQYSFTDARIDARAPVLYYRLRQIDRDGTTAYSGTVALRLSAAGFRLAQNYPNPFSGFTTIDYELPADAPVSLRVYDLLGSEVATLVDQQLTAGSYTLRFDPLSLRLRPGQYLCVLNAGDQRMTRILHYIP